MLTDKTFLSHLFSLCAFSFTSFLLTLVFFFFLKRKQSRNINTNNGFKRHSTGIMRIWGAIVIFSFIFVCNNISNNTTNCINISTFGEHLVNIEYGSYRVQSKWAWTDRTSNETKPTTKRTLCWKSSLCTIVVNVGWFHPYPKHQETFTFAVCSLQFTVLGFNF